MRINLEVNLCTKKSSWEIFFERTRISSVNREVDPLRLDELATTINNVL